MITNGIKRELTDFFARAFPDRPLGDDEDIFALGFGNSLFAMQMVEFVETAFSIVIDGEDLDIDNFRTINAIVRLIEQKQLSAAAS